MKKTACMPVRRSNSNELLLCSGICKIKIQKWGVEAAGAEGARVKASHIVRPGYYRR